jgi:hypothetical protein
VKDVDRTNSKLDFAWFDRASVGVENFFSSYLNKTLSRRGRSWCRRGGRGRPWSWSWGRPRCRPWSRSRCRPWSRPWRNTRITLKETRPVSTIFLLVARRCLQLGIVLAEKSSRSSFERGNSQQSGVHDDRSGESHLTRVLNSYFPRKQTLVTRQRATCNRNK